MLSSFCRFALAGALIVAALPAATISGYNLYLNGSGISTGSGNVSSSPEGDGYLVNGTLGLYDQFGNPIAQSAEVTGPFSFRFTDATITCLGACGTTAFFFSADVFFSNQSSPYNADGQFGIEGSGTGSGLLSAFPSGNSFIELTNISTLGNFSESITLPSGFLIGNDSLLQFTMLLTVDGLSDGDVVSLPNSLFQQVNLAGENSVPEPGTLAIVGAGVAGAIWFRRRQS